MKGESEKLTVKNTNRNCSVSLQSWTLIVNSPEVQLPWIGLEKRRYVEPNLVPKKSQSIRTLHVSRFCIRTTFTWVCIFNHLNEFFYSAFCRRWRSRYWRLYRKRWLRWLRRREEGLWRLERETYPHDSHVKMKYCQPLWSETRVNVGKIDEHFLQIRSFSIFLKYWKKNFSFFYLFSFNKRKMAILTTSLLRKIIELEIASNSAVMLKVKPTCQAPNLWHCL